MEHKFKVTGGFDVSSDLKPVHDHAGNIVGFSMPDGKVLRLVVALELEDNMGGRYEYITKEARMAALGFEALDYDECVFKPIIEKKKNRLKEIAAKIHKSMNRDRHYDVIEICEMVRHGVPGVDRQELTMRQASKIVDYLDQDEWDD